MSGSMCRNELHSRSRGGCGRIFRSYGRGGHLWGDRTRRGGSRENQAFCCSGPWADQALLLGEGCARNPRCLQESVARSSKKSTQGVSLDCPPDLHLYQCVATPSPRRMWSTVPSVSDNAGRLSGIQIASLVL